MQGWVMTCRKSIFDIRVENRVENVENRVENVKNVENYFVLKFGAYGRMGVENGCFKFGAIRVNLQGHWLVHFSKNCLQPFLNKSIIMAGVGRPQHQVWLSHGFRAIKLGGKSAAFCTVCKKSIKNTATKRLLSHR